uniref:Uncharacterized protein n=1 Tax=Pelodiscus sinensis TaxID=13735 RepID=K7GJE4_PELSI
PGGNASWTPGQCSVWALSHPAACPRDVCTTAPPLHSAPACRREQLESSQAAWLAQAESYENTHLGGYRRIYPACGTDKYEPFFKHSGSLFKETVASKAREECARQQLEEIRLKEEQREVTTGKKKKERKENLQGESAGEKSRPRGKAKAPLTRLTYSSARPRDRKTQQLAFDSMRPQEIVEEEEAERIKALLQREHLIQDLGIVDQLSRLLHITEPRPVDVHRPHVNLTESQVRVGTERHRLGWARQEVVLRTRALLG